MSAQILLALAAVALPVLAQQASSASLTIHADRPGPQVNRQLFGQFAEHLGAGIYGGIWVGEDSKIPNTRGYRNDVLQALRDLKVPVVRWPGGCFADEYNWREGVLPVWAEPQPAKVRAPGGRGAGPPRRGGRGAGIRTVPRGCARWKGLRKQRRPSLHTNPSEAPDSFGPSGEGQVPPRSLESDIFSRTRSGRAVAGKAMEPPRRRTARFGNRLGLAVGLRASAHPQCTRFRGP